MGTFINVNDSSFDQVVLKSPVPVLVEFGAEWCGPCRQMEPLLEQLSAESKEMVKLAKVDVDESVDITMKYQVMSLPTLILFVNGEPAQRLSGKQPRDRLVEKFFLRPLGNIKI